MKLTRKDCLETVNAIVTLLNADDNKYEFNYALIRNQSRLKPPTEEIGAVLNANQKERAKLQREHCEKNKDGEPVKIKGPNGEHFTGLIGNAKYEDAIEKINDTETAFFKEEIEFEPYKIKKEYLPKTMNGLAQAGIQKLIEGAEDDG